jgi:hypothetical protein
MLQQNNNIQTLRFVYTDEVTELLNNFAKEHHNDERKKFKTEWNNWVQREEIKAKLNNEIERLKHLGMEDDIMDKMFKSVKYYYCKKLQNKIKPPSRPKPQVKNYTTLSYKILTRMDEHIYSFISLRHFSFETHTVGGVLSDNGDTFSALEMRKGVHQEESEEEETKKNKKNKKNVSPAEAYNDFCSENKEILLEEIIDYRKKVLREQHVEKIVNKDKEIIDDRLNPDILSEKIKKTYKNRFYNVAHLKRPIVGEFQMAKMIHNAH